MSLVRLDHHRAARGQRGGGVAARELSLNISERTLAQRQAQWQPPAPKFERGYGALFSEHITQANEGCDFGFLARPGRNPEPDPR